MAETGECRDAFLNGTYPCSQEEATQLAGTQCHILFGDHQEAKHKVGFLDLELMLPKKYVKIKRIEKKIFVEHKKLIGVTEVIAKVCYTQLCRLLNTYGITFFLVKEKMKRTNKLVPRLLGINKESVVKLDERTKEILHKWPLTHVRRWGASAMSFTLDFGDWSEAYYSVQTTEGEQISQLIGGYISIILKKTKPFFSMKLEPSLTVPNGKLAELKCKVKAYPPAKITWLKDNVPLRNGYPYEITYRLRIPKCEAGDEGTYTCRAANPIGQDASECHLTVAAPPQPPPPPPTPLEPRITTQLTPELSLRNGDNLDLTAEVIGYPPLLITWYRDGTALKGGPDYKMSNINGAVSLHLPKCTQDDGGVYACLATNYYGQDSTRSNVTVLALVPSSSEPLFVARLSPDLGVLSGEPVILKCKVGGYPPPKTTWYKDNGLLGNEPPYEITSKGREHCLQIRSSSEADTGAYNCIATNPSGKNKTACNVSVTAPESRPSKPCFTTQLTPELLLRNGDNHDLSATVTGYPSPRITWYRDGTTLKDDTFYNINGAVNYHLSKCTQDDGGVYACLATNPSGQDSTSSNVTVSALKTPPSKPLFVTRLSPDLGVLSGEPVILKCKVGGYPPPETAWYKDDGLLRNGPPYEITSEGREHCLQIPSCSEADTGAYTCIATNSSGPNKTVCNLFVTDNPGVEIMSKGGESTHRVSNAKEVDSWAYSCLASDPTGQESQSGNVTVAGNMEEEVVELYKPFLWSQITLPEEVQCMAVKTLLHMCGIPFCLRLRANAEYMSPSGGVPFIKDGPHIVSEFDQIVEYLDLKDISLSRVLSGSQRSDMKAYMSLTTNILYNAEVYLSWCCQPVADKVTKARYGSPHPWPLNWILPWYRQQEAKKYLKVQEWLEKTPEEVHEELRLACKALSDKLGDQDFFFLNRPSELDALVYGHLYSILTLRLIDGKIADIVKGFPNLTRYVQRIREEYFGAGNEKQRNTTDTAASSQC